jgi:hypothetical protein
MKKKMIERGEKNQEHVWLRRRNITDVARHSHFERIYDYNGCNRGSQRHLYRMIESSSIILKELSGRSFGTENINNFFFIFITVSK